MKAIQIIALAPAASLAAAGTAQAAVNVTGEAAGVEDSTASFAVSAAETFDSQPTHT